MQNLCRCGVYPRLVRAIQRAGRVALRQETISAAPAPGISAEDAAQRGPGDARGGGTAMKATIWHNPSCSTSRNTLALLHDTPDVELTVVEYLKNPPTRGKLAQLYRDAGIAPREGLRKCGTDAEERGLTAADDATVLDGDGRPIPG